jgi:hypothetical protein
VAQVRHLGPTGVLRASHRALDPKKSTDFDPVHPSTCSETIEPGTIVKVEIPLWPCGVRQEGDGAAHKLTRAQLIFDAGDSLKLVMAGHVLQLPEFPQVRERVRPRRSVRSGLAHIGVQNLNLGYHRVHAGGEYESYLQIPVI